MANRLARATSPYLLQHKDNPVDWWEWSSDAFAEAKRRDVPVLLSVGYAACHWCHVMAHESFEDEATAEVMNARFVNIKVDREERPDVDSVYMESVQAMTGHGGWPMTVFMDHEGRPFFSGTYFPKTPRHGMSSFGDVLEAIHDAWANRRDDIDDQARRLVEAISSDLPSGLRMTDENLATAYRSVASAYDPVNGGFGTAPKFPQQPVLEFLLRVHREAWAPDAAAMLATSLEKMALGGIHDHLAGGFARYSVDATWLVPHFEKMLYDNAQLARLYLWAGIELERDDFIDVARKTLQYLENDLRHPDGGFFSSEDADSEGVEGKFYVWSRAEIEDALGRDAESFNAEYGVTEPGNFEGANILNFRGDDESRWEDARARLLKRRSGRVRPALDDKVVTAWNGLAIRAFAEAGAALNDDHYLGVAADAARFVISELRVDGRLMRSWRDGRVSVQGFLDDHSAMSTSLFTLYAATGDESWFTGALELVRRFESFSKPGGGFFNTADDSETLVKRPSDFTDNPMPSGSAMAAEALLAASLYTGDPEFRDMADQALQIAAAVGERYPTMVGHHLAVIHSAADTRELAIVGPEWRPMAQVFWSKYRPNVVLAGSESTSGTAVPLLESRDGTATLAYLCRGFVCDLPTADKDELAVSLGPS